MATGTLTTHEHPYRSREDTPPSVFSPDIRSKEFAVHAEATEVAPADLELINQRYALRPLTAEEVYVRRIALCNDQVDRTFERFPVTYLKRFSETLPGKPLLAHHDKQQFPLGRFFRAEVKTSDELGLPPSADGRPSSWLVCWVYLVKTPGNEEVRRQIDAGVYSHVSIGYRWADLTCDLCGRSYFRSECPHVIGQQYESHTCTATYSGVEERVEAFEGSLVYLGAQYGAVITKSDNRREEKATLSHRKEGGEDVLAAEGREYRSELRAEILRLGRCLHSGIEAETLLEALGDVGAPRLRELLSDYRKRFDGVFPVEQSVAVRGNCSVLP